MPNKFVLLQYYQALFRDGECFLHVVSLLNGNLDEADGEKLVLNVLQTLTSLLASNDASKVIYFSLSVFSLSPLLSVCLLWLVVVLEQQLETFEHFYADSLYFLIRE